MVFTGDGAFLTECDFNDDVLATYEPAAKQKLPMTYQKFKEKKTHVHGPDQTAINIL
jgi:hypothetical protein